MDWESRTSIYGYLQLAINKLKKGINVKKYDLILYYKHTLWLLDKLVERVRVPMITNETTYAPVNFTVTLTMRDRRLHHHTGLWPMCCHTTDDGCEEEVKIVSIYKVDKKMALTFH